MQAHILIWLIAALTTLCILIRPFKWPEAVWAVTGAALLVILQLIAPLTAWQGVTKGTDVYLFLTGMMLLAETAREEKLFDWLAAHAAVAAKGSAIRLFVLIYLVGVVVTVFLSNDATAVVLTPAVIAVMRAAKVDKPLPYLFICAFVANAASFVLPVSNPANLVIYGKHMPPLALWLAYYGIPSLAAIAITFIILFITQRHSLQQGITNRIDIPVLSRGGRAAFIGIGLTTIGLLICSTFDLPLGLPTAVAGILTTLLIALITSKSPVSCLKGISWSVLPLVAGLFVIVEALTGTGLTQNISHWLQQEAHQSIAGAVWKGGVLTALISNITNNLPSGLIAGNAVQQAGLPEMVKSAVLIGIDVGPNLSISGSLATLLWLVALRREQVQVSFWQFLKLGTLVMTTALLAALAALWL